MLHGLGVAPPCMLHAKALPFGSLAWISMYSSLTAVFPCGEVPFFLGHKAVCSGSIFFLQSSIGHLSGEAVPPSLLHEATDVSLCSSVLSVRSLAGGLSEDDFEFFSGFL